MRSAGRRPGGQARTGTGIDAPTIAHEPTAHRRGRGALHRTISSTTIARVRVHRPAGLE